MILALLVIGSIVVAVGFGIGIGYRAAHVPRSSPQPRSLVQLADTCRDLVYHVERELVRKGKSLADDVTALVNADNPASYSKVIGRLIDSHKAFVGTIQAYADSARELQNQVVRTIVEDELKVPEGPDHSGDRRKETRHPYFCKQWVARYSGDELPGPADFFEVQCRDLSSGGISFFVDQLPEGNLFVVRLGGPQGAKYLTARVRQTSPSRHLEYGRYVLGCEFLGSLHPSALAFEGVLSEQTGPSIKVPGGQRSPTPALVG